MEPMTGVEFLKSILSDYPDPVRILVTGYADMNAVIDSINMARCINILLNLIQERLCKKQLKMLERYFS